MEWGRSELRGRILDWGVLRKVVLRICVNDIVKVKLSCMKESMGHGGGTWRFPILDEVRVIYEYESEKQLLSSEDLLSIPTYCHPP